LGEFPESKIIHTKWLGQTNKGDMKKKTATDGEKMVNKYKNILDIVKALYYIIKDIIL